MFVSSCGTFAPCLLNWYKRDKKILEEDVDKWSMLTHLAHWFTDCYLPSCNLWSPYYRIQIKPFNVLANLSIQFAWKRSLKAIRLRIVFRYRNVKCLFVCFAIQFWHKWLIYAKSVLILINSSALGIITKLLKLRKKCSR